MTEELPIELVREGFRLLWVVGGPLFAALFIGGLLLGLLQAATQVNDPAVGFLPRVGMAIAVLMLVGLWMMERLSLYWSQALMNMANLS